MLHPLQKAAPSARFAAANKRAVCKYMKMITLPKLRNSLRDVKYRVEVPDEVADRARVPIERMVAIG
jgi:quinolinate synthase